MDVSQEYIKQCDCEEIQVKREEDYDFNDGDYYFVQGKVVSVVTRAVQDGLGFIVPDSGDNGIGVFTLSKSSFVWLPRQDQIQEMLGKPNDKWFDYGNDFLSQWAWAVTQGQLTESDYISTIFINGDYKFCCSWEQLWLCIYMKEKHGKLWDGEKWCEK